MARCAALTSMATTMETMTREQPRQLRLVDRRPAPGRLQAPPVRQRDPPVHDPATPGLHPRARPATRSAQLAAKHDNPRAAQRRGHAGRPGCSFYNTSDLRLRQPAGGPRRARGQPHRLHRPVLRRTSTCSSGSSSRTRSPPSTRRTGSPASSSEVRRASTCTRTRCRNADMGDLFEYLIRKFAEAANETAGEHYTPRDAIRLLVDLLFAEEDAALTESRASSARSTTPPPAPAACSPWPRSTCSTAEPRRPAEPVRPGDQRPVLRDLQVRHDRQGPGRRPTSGSATPSPTTCSRARPSTSACPTRPTAWTGSSRQEAVKEERDEAGPDGRFAPGLPADQRRPDAVPAPPGHKMRPVAGRRRPGRRSS